MLSRASGLVASLFSSRPAPPSGSAVPFFVKHAELNAPLAQLKQRAVPVVQSSAAIVALFDAFDGGASCVAVQDGAGRNVAFLTLRKFLSWLAVRVAPVASLPSYRCARITY